MKKAKPRSKIDSSSRTTTESSHKLIMFIDMQLFEK